MKRVDEKIGRRAGRKVVGNDSGAANAVPTPHDPRKQVGRGGNGSKIENGRCKNIGYKDTPTMV